MVTKNINSLFFEPQSFKLTSNILFIPILLLPTLWLVKKRLLKLKELLIFFIWIIGVIVFFGFSSSPISEYYLSNIGIIFITIVSLYLYFIFKSSFLGKAFVVGILLLVTFKNGYFLTTQYYYHKGYVEKKAVVNYIQTDAAQNKYPCIGISYITAAGENVGFRYLFYLSEIHLIHPSLDIPVYNIVIPDELALGEVKQKFGHIGVIPPDKIPPKEIIQKSCQTPNTNLTDSMFGYVE